MRRRSSDQDRVHSGRARAAARAAGDGNLHLDWTDWLPRSNTTFLRGSFGVGVALVDIAAIVLSAVVSGVLYHLFAYGWIGPVEIFIQLGLSISLAFVVANTMRDEYSIPNYLQISGHARRTFLLWNIVSVCALAFGFLTKTTAEISRATIVLFYFGGLASLVGFRMIAVQLARKSASAGGISLRRVFLVGSESEVEGFASRYQPWESGMHVVAAAVLRGRETLDEDLALAAASARMLRPDDVFILAPWSEHRTIDACIDSFIRVPASIHLGPERVLDRFVDARISKIGAVSSLRRRASAAFDRRSRAQAGFRYRRRRRGGYASVAGPPARRAGDQARFPRSRLLPAATLRLQPGAVPHRQIPLDDDIGRRPPRPAGEGG